jgi:hypothetical protein
MPADWRDLGVSEDPRGDLASLGASLASLRECGGRGVAAPTLRSFAFTDADLGAVAERAEVDDNAAASPAPLRAAELVAVLKRAW